MANRGLRLVGCACAVATVAACSLLYPLDDVTSSGDAGTAPDASTPDAGGTDAATGDASSFDAGALPEGLIAYWPFEGSTVDATGKGHTLVSVKTVFVDAGVRGGSVRCAELDSRLESTSPDLAWGVNGVTIFVWVMLEPKDGGAARTLFESGRNADWTNAANKTLGVGLGHRSPSSLAGHVSDGGTVTNISVTGPTEDAKFHAIAFVGERSGMTVYVDGVSAGTTPLSDAGALVDVDPLLQLCGHGNSVHYLGGLLDEVMVWNRALSSEEITTVMNALKK